MSLINDALKRARQLHKKTNPPAGPEIQLQPAESAPKRSKSWIGLVGAAIIVGLAGWLFMNWWNARTQAPQTAAKPPATTNRSVASGLVGAVSTASNVVNSVTNLRADAESALASSKTSDVAPVPHALQSPATETNKVVTPEPARVKTEMAAAAVAPTNPPPASKSETTNAPAPRAAADAAGTAAAPLPASRNAALSSLKLQGIYYRLSKPSVLINNRTLFVGDEIEGARVTAIERYTVKLELSGKTYQLILK